MTSNILNSLSTDTIAAIATPPGKGGIGIVRISGAECGQIIVEIVGKALKPRFAHYSSFLDNDGSVIDSGIALYFPSPHSFTGEDVLELHGHGGSVVLDMILRRVLSLGVRLARPGEFSERAFLNNKLDLSQAEAIADLIESSTEQAARSAQMSMQGVFSKQVNQLVDRLKYLRQYIEAAIDFAEEEIDFLSDGAVETQLVNLLSQLEKVQHSAKQGALLRDGMTVVITGRTNVGKSSLLNYLAGHNAAIVTDIEGTTRDILKERIQLDGMPLHIIDTAGLRETSDLIELEGIRRAEDEIRHADCVLWLHDDRLCDEAFDCLQTVPDHIQVINIFNKIDLTGTPASIKETSAGIDIYLSVKTAEGMDLLFLSLKKYMGFEPESENTFIARRRHLNALEKATVSLKEGLVQLQQFKAGELLAEDLKQAQNYLSEITGEFTSDDLLTEIFSSFCIGK